jgi:hypothetical protein
MRRSFLLSVLLLIAPAAHAWSEFGHELIGELAYRQLTPATRAAVDELLQGEPEPTLAGVAAWADTIRDLPQYEHTGPFHYVRINDEHCVFDRARDCHEEACVVGAIQRYTEVLADKRRPRLERAEALKFVVHFVGDVHQPLHSGHRADRGGNQFQISLDGEGTNLHSVWDYHVIRSADLDFDGWMRRLQSVPVAARRNSPAQWAEASCRKTNAEGFYPRKPGTMSPAYLDANLDFAAQRLREAGAELAAVLERALGR